MFYAICLQVGSNSKAERANGEPGGRVVGDGLATMQLALLRRFSSSSRVFLANVWMVSQGHHPACRIQREIGVAVRPASGPPRVVGGDDGKTTARSREEGFAAVHRRVLVAGVFLQSTGLFDNPGWNRGGHHPGWLPGEVDCERSGPGLPQRVLSYLAQEEKMGIPGEVVSLWPGNG